MANTFPELDVKFVEPSEPSIEYLRKTFKKVDKLINKLHKFFKDISVDLDDIEKIRISDDEDFVIIHTNKDSVKKNILKRVDETDLNIHEHPKGVKIRIE